MTKRPAPPPETIRQPNGKRKRQPHARQPAQPVQPVIDTAPHPATMALAEAIADLMAAPRSAVRIVSAGHVVISDPRYP